MIVWMALRGIAALAIASLLIPCGVGLAVAAALAKVGDSLKGFFSMVGDKVADAGDYVGDWDYWRDDQP